MKNKALVIIALPLLLLSSCDFFLFKSSAMKEVKVYNLDLLENNEENIENAYQQTIKPRFVSGEEYIPYVTLDQYASLYKSHFAETAESKVSRSGSTLTWQVLLDGELCFVSQINFSEKSVLVAGSLEAAYKENDFTRDVAALEHGLKTDYKIANEGGFGNYASYTFYSIKLNYFSNGGEYFIPLSFLDITYSYDSGIYFFYNYAGIYSTRDADAFEDKMFMSDDVSFPINVNSQMVMKNELLSMPMYLREYNANMFFYLFDNFYGFQDKLWDNSRAFQSPTNTMADFCRAKKLYNSLLSSDPATRAQAYSDVISYFDDNHTAIISANQTWGEDSFSRFRYSSECQNRSLLRQTLLKNRENDYLNKGTPGEDIIYSNDGKTAMYMFDSFSFGNSEDVFNADGTVNLEKASKVDTYFNLITTFEKIKNRGGVQNIILDIATNGGGVLGTMMKILSLISPSNKSYIYYQDGKTNQVIEAKSFVDANDDELYDLEDCYGDDFNFYILTSDCSFSCANAFPCYAQGNKIAKVIGQKSGGGECAVAVHFLPNSQYVYHSSNLHLGYFDGNYTFDGFEGGAKPDIQINETNRFFDIEYLSSSIASYQNQTD